MGGTILFQENRIFSGRFPVGLYGPLLVLMPAIFDFKVVHGGGEYFPNTLGRGGGIEIVAILASWVMVCLLYTSPSPRDVEESRMPSSA